VSGCGPTLRQTYIDPNDTCRTAREPIVAAGEEMDRLNRERVEAIADQQVAGLTRPPGRSSNPLYIGDTFQRELQRAQAQQDAYKQLSTSTSGADAAKALAQGAGERGPTTGRACAA